MYSPKKKKKRLTKCTTTAAKFIATPSFRKNYKYDEPVIWPIVIGLIMCNVVTVSYI